jgi:hypothetical protein
MNWVPYLSLRSTWPAAGRHILATHDAESVTVYQAFRPSIATYAVEHQHFGGDFSFTRMSWIKPNFLWMMHRCGWASKEDQQRVLAVRIRRTGFDHILRSAVSSSFDPAVYRSTESWQTALQGSDARLQWDPDHDPFGTPLTRRAIQLGLRGKLLASYTREWLIDIDDITPMVIEQREFAAKQAWSRLLVPEEKIYREKQLRT